MYEVARPTATRSPTRTPSQLPELEWIRRRADSGRSVGFLESDREGGRPCRERGRDRPGGGRSLGERQGERACSPGERRGDPLRSGSPLGKRHVEGGRPCRERGRDRPGGERALGESQGERACGAGECCRDRLRSGSPFGQRHVERRRRCRERGRDRERRRSRSRKREDQALAQGDARDERLMLGRHVEVAEAPADGPKVSGHRKRAVSAGGLDVHGQVVAGVAGGPVVPLHERTVGIHEDESTVDPEPQPRDRIVHRTQAQLAVQQGSARGARGDAEHRRWGAGLDQRERVDLEPRCLEVGEGQGESPGERQGERARGPGECRGDRLRCSGCCLAVVERQGDDAAGAGTESPRIPVRPVVGRPVVHLGGIGERVVRMRRTFEHDRGAAGFGEGECRGGRLERVRELWPGILRVSLGARGQLDPEAIADDADLAQVRRTAAVDQRGVDQDGAFPVA